jgi:hypothetical protein
MTSTEKTASLDKGWEELQTIWDEMETGREPTTTFRDTRWGPGKAFEYLIIRGFELSGADVRPAFSVVLDINEQIDGAVYVAGLSCLIEAKDFGAGRMDGDKARVTADPIAKLRNQLMRRHASVIGLLFSRSGYTAPALTMAHFLAPQAVLLWDKPEIAYALATRDFVRPLLLKYRANVEMGLPFFNVLEAALA